MRNFINARLNKDNLFNVLFFLLFFMSLALGYIVPQPLGVILALVMFASAVILVKVGSPLTFDKEKMEFTTSIGKKTKNSGVGFIFLLLISSFLSLPLTSILTGKAEYIMDSPLNFMVAAFLASAFPVLYCIISNLPIAVYFKKEAWTSLELTGGSSSSSISSSHFQQSDRSIITDPSYRYLSCNVYHKR